MLANGYKECHSDGSVPVCTMCENEFEVGTGVYGSFKDSNGKSHKFYFCSDHCFNEFIDTSNYTYIDPEKSRNKARDILINQIVEKENEQIRKRNEQNRINKAFINSKFVFFAIPLIGLIVLYLINFTELNSYLSNFLKFDSIYEHILDSETNNWKAFYIILFIPLSLTLLGVFFARYKKEYLLSVILLSIITLLFPIIIGLSNWLWELVSIFAIGIPVIFFSWVEIHNITSFQMLGSKAIFDDMGELLPEDLFHNRYYKISDIWRYIIWSYALVWILRTFNFLWSLGGTPPEWLSSGVLDSIFIVFISIILLLLLIRLTFVRFVYFLSTLSIILIALIIYTLYI